MLRGLTFLLSGALFTAYAQQSCDALKSSLSFPDATVTAIESIPAGPAPARGRPARLLPSPAGRTEAPRAVSMLPAYCRVAITLKPSTDSDIKMEAWLPVENWNGKFQMVGNGGWAGSMQGSGDAGRPQRRLRDGRNGHGPHGRGPGLRAGRIRRSWSISRIAPCMRRW